MLYYENINVIIKEKGVIAMKITFMGAGSTVFARNVIGDCMCSEALRDSVFALYDIDGQRLEESRVILEAIADDMKIEVTEADLDDEYKAMAENYGMEVEKVKEYLPTEYVSEDLKIRKCLDTLKQNKPE